MDSNGRKYFQKRSEATAGKGGVSKKKGKGVIEVESINDEIRKTIELIKKGDFIDIEKEVENLLGIEQEIDALFEDN